jgi:hypothetical protein
MTVTRRSKGSVSKDKTITIREVDLLKLIRQVAGGEVQLHKDTFLEPPIDGEKARVRRRPVNTEEVRDRLASGDLASTVPGLDGMPVTGLDREPRRAKQFRVLKIRNRYSLRKDKVMDLKDLTPAERLILRYMHTKPSVTSVEMMDNLDLKRKTIENVLTRFRKRGWIDTRKA